MKIKLRKTINSDLESIYDLQNKCFNDSDRWYKCIINQYLNTGIVIEHDNNIIGVLLQGNITPCESSDKFEILNDIGNEFINNNDHLKEIYGITMLCIDPNYRKKGLGQLLINKHFNINQNKILCLNTRNLNINAINLYKKMGYNNILLIKNKYFLPNEDSRFMIKII
jgi:ribosomal protein S18 acetylase RimI-like enzyme